MSDIDRRRYTYSLKDGFHYRQDVDILVEPPEDDYYHESAMREVVRALSDMWNTEPDNDKELDSHVHAILAHHKELLE